MLSLGPLVCPLLFERLSGLLAHRLPGRFISHHGPLDNGGLVGPDQLIVPLTIRPHSPQPIDEPESRRRGFTPQTWLESLKALGRTWFERFSHIRLAVWFKC